MWVLNYKKSHFYYVCYHMLLSYATILCCCYRLVCLYFHLGFLVQVIVEARKERGGGRVTAARRRERDESLREGHRHQRRLAVADGCMWWLGWRGMS